jgi:hypothetical protein
MVRSGAKRRASNHEIGRQFEALINLKGAENFLP